MAEGRISTESSRGRNLRRRVAFGVLVAGGLVLTFSGPALAASPPASPSLSPVNLRTAASFAVLAGTPAITNAGPSTISGSLGISPAAAVTGFPLGKVVNGTIEAATAAAANAKNDVTAAYDAAAGTPCASNKTGQNLGGQTLTPGTYCQTTAATLTGTVTLSGNGVFVFQIGSTLVTAPGANVVLTNGADACDVYWQVGSSATIDTTTTFAGTIMALADITMNDGANVTGRVLARNGQVTLINDKITVPACTSPSTSASASASTSTSTSTMTTPASLCPPAACPTRAPSLAGGPISVTGPTPGPAALATALGGSEPSLANVDMPLPVEAATLAPAPILDIHQFPWLWPLLIVINVVLLMAIGAVVRRTGDRLPRGADLTA